MSKYNLVKLNQLCVKITDGSHYSPKGIDKGVPMLSVKDMLNNRFSYNECKYISEEDYLDLVKSDCKPLINDVLIAKDGSYLKHVFVIKTDKKQAVLSSIGILRPNLKKIIPEYLKYYLQTNSVKETVAKKYVSGSALPRIILKNFGEIDVIYKDLNLQQKIAKVLSDLDAKIEINNKINQELDAMAKLLYDYWFVQFDFPDKNGKPYKSSGGLMIYNDELKREIPEGWQNETIGDVAYVIDPHPSHRAPKEVKEGYPFAGIGDIDEYGNIKVEKARVINADFVNKQEKDYQINETSLGYGRVGTVGKVVRLRKQEFRYALSPTMAIINPKLKNENAFVYFNVKSKTFYNEVLKRTSGTTRPAIGIMELRKIPIIVPRNAYYTLIIKFDDKVSKSLNQIENLNSQNQKLTALRDWLLPMLMNGQVMVGDAAVQLGMVAEDGETYKINL